MATATATTIVATMSNATTTEMATTAITTTTAPVITIHGTEDAAVPYVQAVNMHKKLREVGTKERLHTIKGKKHGDFTPEELTQIYQEIWEFLESVGVKTTVD